ncbi:TetR/AcrR family transcriptional regulator [Terriglobus saanensis]|uniref:Regulatory protein TetR n=1 Tax=Terriglobus saanensis (strain ATCC BAA-1853 / DSM 23119 / SP1PR4) TaxID=401053 RepID=E8V3J3_TERSS|nr:TetR/AcrR family transcriptional regulator [Terriglobus saanensis]ADV83606.1 regulatory protein TetR [Terriglobus saanensis SP1PR4]
MRTARHSSPDVSFNSQIQYRALPDSVKKNEDTGKLTKHEMKTQETRELLLRAAERIFVRDGYERAELGEIARLAGRTKGAIYAHFKSKEDVFLALVQDHALRRRAIMRKFMEHSSTIEGNLDAFRKYFLDFAADDTWGFLLLEFRLYSVRNPDSKEHFRKVYESILPVNEEESYSALLGPASKSKEAISRTLAVHTGFSMLTALQLECKFDPNTVDSSAVRKIAGKLFDMLFSQ